MIVFVIGYIYPIITYFLLHFVSLIYSGCLTNFKTNNSRCVFIVPCMLMISISMPSIYVVTLIFQHIAIRCFILSYYIHRKASTACLIFVVLRLRESPCSRS